MASQNEKLPVDQAAKEIVGRFEAWLSGRPVDPRSAVQSMIDDLLGAAGTDRQVQAACTQVEYGFGCALPCAEAVARLAGSDRSLIEVCAGTGFLAQIVNQAGGSVTATNIANLASYRNRHITIRVDEAEAVAAVRAYPGHDVLMAWPPYSDAMASHVLHSLRPGLTLYFIGDALLCGENESGVPKVATPAFFHELAAAAHAKESINMPGLPGYRNFLHVLEIK
ncbi:MAG TPA: hypothetical protein VMV79_04230 [Alphaproteobacteria bacterium]|nr:hypothetical protein [Alphaproteobacteria bacterium]